MVDRVHVCMSVCVDGWVFEKRCEACGPRMGGWIRMH